MTNAGDTDSLESPAKLAWRGVAPIAILAVLLATLWGLGAGRFFPLDDLLARRDALEAVIAAHYALSLAAFAGIYVAAAALALPGASALTLVGGSLFGWLAGAVVSAVSATTGATMLFAVARSFLGATWRERTGARIAGLRRGFERDAVSYMLFLRLMPLAPFPLVNLAAALLGVRAPTFVWTTFVGILPSAFAFAFVGAGLRDIATDQKDTRGILLALAGLGLGALTPVLARRCRALRNSSRFG